MSEHGSGSRYTNWGCRCAACREAHRIGQRERYLRRLARPIPETTLHGSNSTYTNWGCRCPECTEAHRVAQRAFWAQRGAS